jgi:hypothetical protein
MGKFHLPNIGGGVDAMLAESHSPNSDANLPQCDIDAQTLLEPLTSLPSIWRSSKWGQTPIK